MVGLETSDPIEDRDITDVPGMVHKHDPHLTVKAYPLMFDSIRAIWGLMSLLYLIVFPLEADYFQFVGAVTDPL